jgi:hypothetical protein
LTSWREAGLFFGVFSEGGEDDVFGDEFGEDVSGPGNGIFGNYVRR